MGFLQQVIRLNNNLDNNWHFREAENGSIIAEDKELNKQLFDSTEEFYTWLRTSAITAIKNRY